MTLRAALIVDNLSLAKWQMNALAEASELFDLKLVLNCTNTQTKKRLIKNFCYYVLNILSLKNAETRPTPLGKTKAKVVNFEAIYEGIWQKIPPELIDQLAAEKIDIVIKFGMNLLTVDQPLSPYCILSFHHGNPAKYRGRPAGFYEILNGEKKSGTIVQKLSNELDAGEVFAFAETKVVNYSYKKTALNYFSASRFLLRKAIQNFKNSEPVNIAKSGKNYRLPSNFTVIRFVCFQAVNLAKKLIYGGFFEKRWKVAIGSETVLLEEDHVLSKANLDEIPIRGNYNLYADPFFSVDSSLVRLEALSNKSGLGEIIEVALDNMESHNVILSGHHYSYPFAFSHENKEYLLPEVASHSPQYFYPVNSENGEKTVLAGLEEYRIVDATLYKSEGHWYLFFGMNHDAQIVLNLWIADSLSAKFKPHPDSPVAINPSLARMGGGLIARDGSLYRLGQNNEGEYGESLSILRILECTPNTYREKSVGSISMSDAKGPHSLNFNADHSKFVLDYYEDRFSFFAGVRRLKARLQSS